MKMIARISTMLECTENQLWNKISEPASLQYVASPILSFKPVEGRKLDDRWQVGTLYPLKLYFMKIIPLGRHDIQIVRIDEETNTIMSRERGRLARVWNHKIHFQATAPGKVSYTDEIEIESGWLTPGIWLFAQLFYWHRQRRWKRLLGNLRD